MKPILSLLSLARSDSAWPSPRRRQKARRPLVELLEDRTVPTAIVPPSGIVSWWTGDNMVADLVGGNNGTLNNGAGYATGHVAGGFNFDGIDDNFQATTTGLPTGSADRTVELWARIDTQVAEEAMFTSYGTPGSTAQSYGLGTNNGNVFVSTWGPAIFGPALQNGRWYHVAATNVGTSFKLYLDGALVNSGTLQVNTPANTSFYMGRQVGSYGDIRRLDGMVDEVTVYNRALSAAEIQSIYLAGSDGKLRATNTFTADYPSVTEGAAGAIATVSFTITRAGSLAGPATVNWTTADDTAKAGTDYVAASGHLDFQDGESQKTVTVTVNGDDMPEGNETFQLVLSTTTQGYTAGGGQATIVTDDVVLGEVGDASGLVAPGSGGLSSPKDLVLGPDGKLYVASAGTNSVLRYDAATGQLVGTFVAASSGGLSGPYGLAFGPDGNLYVGSTGTNAIYKYNGSTGAFLSTFVSAGSGGLNDPRGLVFGPDGNLYVSSHAPDAILRYQGPSGPAPGSPLPSAGQPGATFVAAGSGGLVSPLDLTFGPDGNLYVASTNPYNAVLRFDGATGAFLDAFVPAAAGLDATRGLAFDQEGRLYVASLNANAIYRFNTQTQLLEPLVARASSTLAAPVGMTFDAQGALLISSRDTNGVARYDRGVIVTLTAASSTPVSVDYTTADGTAVAGSDYLAQTGTVTFAPGQTSRRILLATRDDLAVETDESFSVQLSNVTGGVTVASTRLIATIVDDDATRQITITDAAATEGDHAAHDRGFFVNDNPGGQFNPLVFGPDGNLYVGVAAGVGAGSIRRYSGTTGAFIDTFVGPGRIQGPRDIRFSGGFLYVGSEYTDEVLRFSATTGAFDRVFVTAGSGGIDAPHGLSFGPDANGDGVPELYVSGRNSNNVVRYNGVTGLPLGTYVSAGSGGLSVPEGLTFDPTQTYLYVTSAGSTVRKYNASTGAYVGVGASPGLSTPKDVKFGSDGLLYVISAGNNRILRFTAAGAYVDDYIPAGSGGMTSPYRMAFGPDGDLYVTTLANSEIFRFGTESEVIFTVSLSTTSSLPVTVEFATADGSATSGSDYTAVSGTVTFVPGVTSATIHVPILDDSLVEPTELFALNLPNAAGGSITDGQATASIADNDTTKFYVVDDGSTDRTYRYGTPGNSVGNSTLATGDTAPRGVAANAAGTTVWVADANGSVYVYNAAGAPLGSWTASGLPAKAQIEGIATNGTDIWIVESKQGKVFKYTGAASLRSGSQTAASSFSLASGNGAPKGIVTDGTSLWVVNDAANDKVLKYNLSGTLLGSWIIDAANASPTGLTINPNNVSDIWIVDSGTDKVYQYTAAASRTSGSQNAAASFALAASNTNPQDIADPPPPDMLLTPKATPLVLSPRFVVGLSAVSAVGPASVPSDPSLASRDAVFALLAREPLATPGGAPAPHLNNPTSTADRAPTPAGASGGQNPLATGTSVTPEGNHSLRPERSAVDPRDGSLVDADNRPSEAADLFSDGPANDAA